MAPTKPAFKADMESGDRSPASTGTPMFYINGRTLRRSSYDYERLAAAIEHRSKLKSGMYPASLTNLMTMVIDVWS